MYNVIIDEFSNREWDQICESFTSNNIYQSGLYGELHCKGIFRSCSRIAIFNDQMVKAAAQLRIIKVPGFQIGVADIDWGPLFDSSSEESFYYLEALLNEMSNEFCLKRHLQMRIRPRAILSLYNMDEKLHRQFEGHGFTKTPTRPYHTVLINLEKPLETINAEFHSKWRNQLNIAMRGGLKHEYGNSIEYFDRFYTIYKEMWKKKRFPTGVRMNIIRKLQNELPLDKKLLITIVSDGQRDIGATVCAVYGDTMLYMLGATSPDLRNDSRPGYLLQWLHIQKAKELNMKWYDLGGYDDNVESIARFKKRTNGLQVIYPGQYENAVFNSNIKIYNMCENIFHKIRRISTGR